MVINVQNKTRSENIGFCCRQDICLNGLPLSNGVTHLIMPHRPQKTTKPYRTFVEFHPYQPSQKCFFCQQFLEFFTKKTTRYHSDTIPISFRRNTNPKMYPIFRQILRRHLSLSLKTCNLQQITTNHLNKDVILNTYYLIPYPFLPTPPCKQKTYSFKAI